MPPKAAGKPAAKGGSSAPSGAASSSAPAAPTPATDRRSRWESSSDRPSSDNRPAPADRFPKPPAGTGDRFPKPPAGTGDRFPKPPAGASGPAAPISPHDRPFPGPGGPPLHLRPLPDGPAPAPSYGFHNLDRRTITLADGSVRSYFALPPDYTDDPIPPFPPIDRHLPPPFPTDAFRDPRGPKPDYWSSLNLDGPSAPPAGLPAGPSGLKRKFEHEHGDEFAWHRQHVLQYGNPNAIPLREERRMGKWGVGGGGGGGGGGGAEVFDDFPQRRARPEKEVAAVRIDVDEKAFNKAFLKFAKVVNEDPTIVKNYLENGKHGPLTCVVCDRSSKEFTDVHSLVVHTYNARNPDMRVDHLGLHKALCVLMGWNYAKEPENTKVYHSLPADEAAANKEDLILWPPTVVVHNTNTGRRKDGRMEGLGNKDMDTKLKELGFGGGKSKSLFGKDGHTGITVVKYANTPAGLEEAERLTEYFEKDNHGRSGWEHVQATLSGVDDDKNPALVKVDAKSGEKKRILYGYLATATDLGKVDQETRKNAVVKSSKNFDLSE